MLWMGGRGGGRGDEAAGRAGTESRRDAYFKRVLKES